MDDRSTHPNRPLSFRRILRRFVWSRPRLYRFIGVLRGHGDVLDTNYDIAVDGYTRSGNTYAWQMLRVTQVDKIKVKVHHHLPTFLINAVLIHKPVCLTIRPAVDAVASWLVYDGGEIISELKQYIDFYTVLLPHRSNLLVLPFDAITRDFRIDLELMNQRFKLGLQIPSDLDGYQQEAFARIDDVWRDKSGKVDQLKVGRPNQYRAALTQAKKEQLREPCYAELLQECDRLYAIYRSEFLRELDKLNKRKSVV